jgi:GT2 family glycosyltransferase
MQPRLSIIACTSKLGEATKDSFKVLLMNEIGALNETSLTLISENDKDHLTNQKYFRDLISQNRITLCKSPAGQPLAETYATLAGQTCSDFVLLLGAHSWLKHGSISKILDSINKIVQIDLLYDDEEQVYEDATDTNTILLPDFSPERLLANFYFPNFVVYRNALLQHLGGFRSQFGQSVIYDAVLRISESSRVIHHIPHALHQTIDQEEAHSSEIILDEIRCVEDALRRSGVKADVDTHLRYFRRIKRHVDPHQLVSIVIPTAGKTGSFQNNSFVDNCLDSILRVSRHNNYEVIVVHDHPEMFFRSNHAKNPKFQLVGYDRPFNFSDKCNLGALHSSSEYLIFLNDDTEILSTDWIETLIGHLQDDSVGACGPLLLLPNKDIQSAGIFNNPGPQNYGVGEHWPTVKSAFTYAVSREVSGLTGACLAIRKDRYFQVGGFSLDFPNNFNDLDLNFKLQYQGYRLIWTPHAQLIHFESQSRDPWVNDSEFQKLRDRWGREFGKDKFTRIG